MQSLKVWLEEPHDSGTTNLKFLHRLIGLLEENVSSLDTSTKLSPNSLTKIQLGNEVEHSVTPSLLHNSGTRWA